MELSKLEELKLSHYEKKYAGLSEDEAQALFLISLTTLRSLPYHDPARTFFFETTRDLYQLRRLQVNKASVTVEGWGYWATTITQGRYHVNDICDEIADATGAQFFDRVQAGRIFPHLGRGCLLLPQLLSTEAEISAFLHEYKISFERVSPLFTPLSEGVTHALEI